MTDWESLVGKRIQTIAVSEVWLTITFEDGAELDVVASAYFDAGVLECEVRGA